MLQICCKSRISLASVPAMSWKARFDSQKNYGKNGVVTSAVDDHLRL